MTSSRSRALRTGSLRAGGRTEAFRSGRAPHGDAGPHQAVRGRRAGSGRADSARPSSRIAELDAALSDYKPDSELNRAARDGAGAPVRVGDDLFRVLGASQKLAAETAGAFDVTLGPVIRLWREARKDRPPPAAGGAGRGTRAHRLSPSCTWIQCGIR